MKNDKAPFKYEWFALGDFNGFFGLAFDNMTNLSFLAGILIFAFGFPARPYALAAHVALLAEVAPGAPWMVAGLAVDIRPLIGPAVEQGGHVRVGLEDAPLGTEIGNLAWVEDAVRRVRAAGGEPATGAEVRQALSALA